MKIIALISAFAILGIMGVASWFTHIFHCIHDDAWGFLIAGAIFFPIAIVHGFSIWLGYW